MKVQITQYNGLGADANSRQVPLGGGRITGIKRTAAGDFAALHDACRLIRVATDTAIHLKPNGTGAADTDDMMPANTVEFFTVAGGAVVSIIAA